MKILSANRLSIILSALLIPAFICSCNPMKKNVMSDNSDDVAEAVISVTGEGSFLTVKEEIFQAVSKSDDRGFRRISGYAEYRISSYDINTGKLLKRIELGDRKENECMFLCETPGKLWYKSVDPELGFHARNPKTLEVIVTQNSITDANPFLKNNLSLPDWNNISRYYGLDISNNKPVVSDNSGYLYSIDPESLKAEKYEGSIENFKSDNSCTSTSIKTDVNSSVYLSGDPRNSFNLFGKDLKEPSFLKGAFLKSSVRLNPDNSNPDFFAPQRKEADGYRREIDSLEKILAQTDTSATGRQNKIQLKYKLQNADRQIDYLKKRIKYAEDNLKRTPFDDYFEIITADKSVFVLSQTDVTDKAKTVISKVKLNSDTTASIQWQTELKDIYREPDKGFDKSSFEVVFSKGNPDLKTMRVLESENKLIFIFQLKATCIDTANGNILWSINL
jgi:hypothetical protein